MNFSLGNFNLPSVSVVCMRIRVDGLSQAPHWISVITPLSSGTPRANLLADIATEEPIARRFAEFQRYGRAQFDGEITDALRRIENARLGKRFGRTGIETGRAGPAMVGGERFIRRQFEIG